MVGSGGMLQTFTPPLPSTNSVSIPMIGAGWSGGPCFGGLPGTITAKANLQVTVTGTWTPDIMAYDNTPPPGVWLQESSTACANDNSGGGPIQAGQANDGWGDAPTTSTLPGYSPIGTSAPPNGVKYVQQSGGSFTVSLSLSASASGTQSMYVGGYGAGASVGPITIKVHAQPYNFRLSSWTDGANNLEPPIVADNTTGTLYFHYSFSSTDGIIGDAVSNVVMYELLDFSGNNSGNYPVQNGHMFYTEPSPPVNIINPTTGGIYGNPTPDKGLFNSTDASKGQALDTLSPPVGGFMTPYNSASWHLSQSLLFDDAATQQTGVPIPGPDNHSPFTITRTVTPGATTNTGTYTVTKAGATATRSLP